MAQNAVLTMRPARDDDEPFLRELFSIIDSERLALNQLDPDSRLLIINHQFSARDKYFNSVDIDNSHFIILTDDVPVGRIIIMQDGQGIILGDLAILPGHRRKGIATAAIQGIQAESVQSKRPITLQVEKFANDHALSLYLRLGFQIVQELDTHYQMRWSHEALG